MADEDILVRIKSGFLFKIFILFYLFTSLYITMETSIDTNTYGTVMVSYGAIITFIYINYGT